MHRRRKGRRVVGRLVDLDRRRPGKAAIG
jgi:hypothetical protein